VCFLNVELKAQNLTIKGKVLDGDGNSLPGTAVIVKGTTNGTSTNDDGDYMLSNVPAGSILEFRLVGYVDQDIKVANKTVINAILIEESESLDDVTVVAFATQKRESVIASVSTVKPAELKVPSSNLTTAFAGRIAGLISYQRTGEPGQDNAEFFIRGVTTFGTGKANPLILIDGVEMTTDDLARLTTDDIASFSIMKDANATALYGARGANGVILVNTKEGREGKLKIQLRIEGSLSSPTENVELADPVTYMRLHNEAVRTRNAMISLPYPTEKIVNTERGIDPVRYPAVNWQDMLFNDNTFNQRYNLNVSGGGAIARYYVAASYSRDNGIIKMDKRNNFNNNIQIDRYVLRANVNINLTKTTEIVVRLHGAFDDYSGPLDGGTALYNKALNANPVYFLPYYEPDEATKYYKHILFGNYNTGGYLNPYADMVKGYKSNDRSNMSAQFELKQNLDFITKGLSARAMFNVNRYSLLEMKREYIPFYYALETNVNSNEYRLRALNPNDGRDYLEQTAGNKELTSTMYFEGAVQYNREFAKKHAVSGLLVYTLRESLDGNVTNDLQASLPFRNLGLAGRLTYGYDSRYFIEANFGYNGTERFAANERFGFFPSIGGGWILTNEAFMKPFENTLSKLKLKATYGLVGNDQIGDSSDRFFYLSKVNPNDGNRSFRFGEEPYYSRNGVSISRYANPYVTWEISRKMNLGLELNLWKSLEIQVDYFTEKRSNILQVRSYIPTTMGLQATPSSNIGKASGKGVDMSVDYNKSFTKDIWMVLRGNFTYATSKYDVYEEPDYINAPRRSHKDQKISQQYGYVAERLFLDEKEVANSPQQLFDDYLAGDIKYKDINGDMQIDENDQVPIGYPTTPEIIYGFGVSFGYQNLDFSCFFQGSARSSFWIDANATAPFVNNRALLKYWADDHWSEDDRNIHAMWPRLSEAVSKNNTQRSTWFMRDGAFLRLKTAEIGYSLPHKWINRVKMQGARIYISGNNLLLFSKFKMWDIEMAGNGLAYPIQRVFNFGINIDF
jgi:TonB-linked SusC/RagA family outer membrane protein